MKEEKYVRIFWDVKNQKRLFASLMQVAEAYPDVFYWTRYCNLVQKPLLSKDSKEIIGVFYEEDEDKNGHIRKYVKVQQGFLKNFVEQNLLPLTKKEDWLINNFGATQPPFV